MSPSTSQKFIANIERFGRLLGETLNREVMEFIEARENIGIAKFIYEYNSTFCLQLLKLKLSLKKV